MWAYHCIFSHFGLISQARKVKLRHFKSLKPSTWYGKCREAMEKCSSLFLTAQWAKMWPYRHIFKSLKSSTWNGQCRKAMEKCSSLISTAQWAKNVSQLEHTWGQNDSNFRLGENWFVRAGNFLGRSYCLHVANRLMYPLTTDVPTNHQLLTFNFLGGRIILVKKYVGPIPLNKLPVWSMIIENFSVYH